MNTPKTREVVKAASIGSDSYSAAMKALQRKYGRPRTIANENIKFLTKKSTFGYNWKDLTHIYETEYLRCHGQAVSKYLVNTDLCSINSGQSEYITVKCHVVPKLQAITSSKRPEELCIKGKSPHADPL